jgi:hypothetical protein
MQIHFFRFDDHHFNLTANPITGGPDLVPLVANSLLSIGNSIKEVIRQLRAFYSPDIDRNIFLVSN